MSSPGSDTRVHPSVDHSCSPSFQNTQIGACCGIKLQTSMSSKEEDLIQFISGHGNKRIFLPSIEFSNYNISFYMKFKII
jgi:hypothetical protein